MGSKLLLMSCLVVILFTGCAQEPEAQLEVTIDEVLAESGCRVFSEMAPLFTWTTLDKNQLEELDDQLAFMNQQFIDAAKVNDAVIYEGKYIDVAQWAGFYRDQFLDDKNTKKEFRFLGAAGWERRIRDFCAEL